MQERTSDKQAQGKRGTRKNAQPDREFRGKIEEGEERPRSRTKGEGREAQSDRERRERTKRRREREGKRERGKRSQSDRERRGKGKEIWAPVRNCLLNEREEITAVCQFLIKVSKKTNTTRRDKFLILE